MASSKRRSREFWEKHVRGWRSSEESCAAYSKRTKINPRTLSWWAWKLEAEAKAEAEAEVEHLPFIELMSVAVEGRVELEIEGVTVRVPNDFEAETLARVLKVLGSR
jgi:hypothetical protein